MRLRFAVGVRRLVWKFGGSLALGGMLLWLGALWGGCVQPPPTEEKSAEVALSSDAGKEQNEGSSEETKEAAQEAAPEAAPEPPKESSGSACIFARRLLPFDVSEGGRLLLEKKMAEGFLLQPTVPADWTLLDQDDRQRWVIRPPYKGSQKAEIAIRVTCPEGERLHTESLNVQALRWEALPSWEPGKTGPQEREHPRMWIHDKTPDTLWLFGGLLFFPKQFTPAYDLWKLDLKTHLWSKVEPSTEAPKITTGAFASAPGSSLIYGFGGEKDSGITNALPYSFDSETLRWTAFEQDSYVEASASLNTFVYDAPRKRYIAACGYKQGFSFAVHCHTAAFSPDKPAGQRWTKLGAGGTEPTGRYGSFATFDPEDERLILFSGAQMPTAQNPVNPAEDTWALDLKASPPFWRRLTPADPQPPGRRNGCSAYDPKGHRFFVFGGTSDGRKVTPGLFVLHLDSKNEAWYRVEASNPPPNRASCTGLYDAGRKRVLFGFGNSEAGIFTDLQALHLP